NAGTITAATFGRGLWRSPLYSACTSSLALSGSETGNLYYEAASTINSTQQIDGGTGTEVFYKANDYVQMNPGFAAIAGSNFKAFIGPCGTGIPTFRLLNNTYGITDTRMLVKTQLNRLNNALPTAGNRVELEVKNDIREIKLNAGSNTFVQAYYVRKTDNEIVAWLLREPVRTGVYQVQVTDKLLTGKDLKLVALLGDERKELDL
ncbi:MAG: hypothetical protein JNM68_11675, partial [Dinghuibacter sp.]|nr:hypothetical protein [Dinghuibacter sp.]